MYIRDQTEGTIAASAIIEVINRTPRTIWKRPNRCASGATIQAAMVPEICDTTRTTQSSILAPLHEGPAPGRMFQITCGLAKKAPARGLQQRPVRAWRIIPTQCGWSRQNGDLPSLPLPLVTPMPSAQRRCSRKEAALPARQLSAVCIGSPSSQDNSKLTLNLERPPSK